MKVTYFEEKGSAYKGSAQGLKATNFYSGAVQFVQHGVPIEAGKSYKVSVWLKGKIRVPVQIMLRKEQTPYTTYFEKAVKVSNEWKRYEFTGMSRVTDEKSMFMIKFKGDGELWVDEASLGLAESKPVEKAKMRSPEIMCVFLNLLIKPPKRQILNLL